VTLNIYWREGITWHETPAELFPLLCESELFHPSRIWTLERYKSWIGSINENEFDYIVLRCSKEKMLEYILGLPTEKRYEALINALYGQSSSLSFF
jgi:RimJ/RimL family protein N-acetyltransferase